MGVLNTLQEAVTKIIPKKKKCKKAKWLSEETLQIAEERREAKGKRERKRYTQLNAEFQGITRSNKKVFLNAQCEETEENNGMQRLEISFKKIGEIKGAFHVRMGTITDRNGKT